MGLHVIKKCQSLDFRKGVVIAMETKQVAGFLLASICLFSLLSDALNTQPIIGILSQSTHGSFKKYGNSFIVASYVKFLEAAGARVVPILINQPDSYYQEMFESLNGVLFPGGAQLDLINSPYGKAGKKFYDLAIKNYDKSGDYFPIWGECLGLELLQWLTANKDLLTTTDADDVSYPLTFSEGFRSSRLFSKMSESIEDILETEKVTYNFHHFGLTPTNFTKNSALDKFYRILSTNTDKKGLRFISTMEAIHYPIYAIQFHPEKNAFEWKSNNLDHTGDAILTTQYFANFFVSEARKNYHSFKKQTADKYLIYNHPPTDTTNISSDYEQVYFFSA